MSLLYHHHPSLAHASSVVTVPPVA